MTEDDVESLVARVAAMDLEALRELWGTRYGAPPPLRSEPILRMMLAWRIQAEIFGGLDTDTCRMLARTGAPKAEGLQFGMGTKLSRNWKGRKIEVIVQDGGFRWDDKIFPSLSAAATAIAGCRWNGPRFFGLRDTS